MRYLRKPFNYASNGNYIAPTKAWDGQPRIAVVTDNDLNNGATPNTAKSAEVENAVNKIFGDALAVQSQAALQNWSAITIPQVGTDTYVSIVGMRRLRAYGANLVDWQRQVILIGADSADSNKLRICTSNDGSVVQASPTKYTIGGFTAPVFATPGDQGELIVINNGVVFAYTTNSTVTWTPSAGYSGPPSILAAHYVKAGTAAGYYALTSTTALQLYRGSTLPNLSTGAGGPVTIATPGASAFVANKCEFADNGAVIMLAGVTAAGVAQVYRSTDGGATWSTSLVMNVAAANCNICFSDYWQLFFAWADTGELYTSSDGAAWNTVTTGRTPANGFLSGRGTLHAVGAALVKATSTGSSTGIAYTFDMGATWNYWYINDGAGIVPLVLRTINNRLFATDGKTLWRSGQLGAPSLAET